MQKEILKNIKTLVVAAILAAGVSYVYAWTGPTAAPPDGNTSAPINVSAVSQTKSGALWASGFFTTGGGYFGGDVGIGTQSPEARLDVRAGSCYYKLQTEGFYTNCSVNTPTYLTISSDTANYNIATALGNPSTAKNVILTINSGVKVYSNSTSQPALDTGTLPSGSTVTVINNGTVVGKGGVGGNGGSNGAPNGGSGGSGGDAINIQLPITINNTNGNIFGAGGAGGGGGASGYGGGLSGAGGGGGGGGAGTTCGAGGTGGIGAYGYPGAAGSTGCSAGGTGGSGGNMGFGESLKGGTGGSGGEYGISGNSGQRGGTADPTGSGGAGGSAGKAINLNGNTITWLGGNNETQVKGAVN